MVKVFVIVKSHEVYQKFCTMTFENYRATIRLLVGTHMLVYVRGCVFTCVRYRSDENSYVHKYMYIYTFLRLQTSV